MKASETHLGKILEGNNQFVVPLFQRPYTWEESRWKVLWADLLDLCEEDSDFSHSAWHKARRVDMAGGSPGHA